MGYTLTLNSGEDAVTITGLSSRSKVSEAAFDGITATLTGAEVDNFSDLAVTGSARRIIWKGKVDGVDRNAVLIVDNAAGGALKGVWLIYGEEPTHLTYYADSSKLTDASISLQFPDKAAALKPRTFTYLGEYSLLSLGSAFEHVTIEGNSHSDIYLSRTLKGSSCLSGVIKCGDTAVINNGEWKFNDASSFVVETLNNRVKFHGGRDS